MQFREVKHAHVCGLSGEGTWIVVQGGRASARETVGRVAAGAVAKKLLATEGIEVVAYVTELGGIKAEIASSDLMSFRRRPSQMPFAAQITRQRRGCRSDWMPFAGRATAWRVVVITAMGVPAGLGEPVFDKLDGISTGAPIF